MISLVQTENVCGKKLLALHTGGKRQNASCSLNFPQRATHFTTVGNRVSKIRIGRTHRLLWNISGICGAKTPMFICSSHIIRGRGGCLYQRVGASDVNSLMGVTRIFFITVHRFTVKISPGFFFKLTVGRLESIGFLKHINKL
jgi:hypothetical protein